MERKFLSLEDCKIKFTSAGDDDVGATFTGYASVFNGKDSYGDTILPGAFKPALKKSKPAPKMFFNHASWGLPIGRWVSVAEDDTGLFVEGEFTPELAMAADVRAAMKHGTLDGLSIGFMLAPNGYKDAEDGGRIIKRIDDLVEISVVTFPADRAARVDLASVKGQVEKLESLADLESFLREAGGFSRGLATAVAARARMLVQRDVGPNDPAPVTPDIADLFRKYRIPAQLTVKP